MTTSTDPKPSAPEPARPANADAWAQPVDRLAIGLSPSPDALTSTVVGRRVTGPLQGFGRLWQKTFRVRLPAASEVTPEEVVATWKAEFATFWPKGNRFYAPLAGIKPGELALLAVTAAGPVKLHTGILVMYADSEAFTFMTPEGHMLAAWITFSSYRDSDGRVVVQAQELARASDPLFEMGMILGGHRNLRRFWEATVRNVAARFGVDAVAETEVVCVDKRRQWRQVGNVRYNAGFRSMLYLAGAPLRWVRRRS